MERYQRLRVLGRGGSATVVLARLRGSQPLQRPVLEDGGAASPLPRLGASGLVALPGASAEASEDSAEQGSGGGEFRVIKEVELRGDERRRAEGLREAEVLKSLLHPNIIAYHEVLFVDGRLCIVMEYAAGGDLAGAIAARRARSCRFLEREAMAVFVQLAIALQYIHQRRVLHRDLKSKNVFLTRAGVAKLGDFGIAKVFGAADASLTATQVGTPYYLPPEMCANQPYGFAADIWCLGVLFYELLALEVPFSAPTVPALASKIVNAEPHPVPLSYSAEARALLGRLLSKRAEERPTSREIVAMPHVRRSAMALLAATSPSAGAGADQARLAGAAGAAGGAGLDGDGDGDRGLQPSGGPAPAAGPPPAAGPRPPDGPPPGRRPLPGAGPPAAAAQAPAAAAEAGMATLSDIDWEALLNVGVEEQDVPDVAGAGAESVGAALGEPAFGLEPIGGAGASLGQPLGGDLEAERLRCGLVRALEETASCDRLLHELEQEFNFT